MFHPVPKMIARAVGTALAFSALGAQAADPVGTLDKIDVTGYGRGEFRQVESVTSKEIAQLIPGSSPLEAIARFPSVHVDSADSQGAYEWSSRIGVRGFNQNQLGFTLDGVPLGDMSYGNYNGLHISRAVITENVARSELAQGAGTLETASTSNLGGTLQFFTMDPSHTAGGYLAQTIGSHADRRTFVRGETGDTGYGRAYVSYVDQAQDKWKGGGQQRSQQFNAKYVADVGESKVTAFYNTSRRRELDYQDLSQQLIARPNGYYIDNTYPNYPAAVALAQQYCGVAGTGNPYSPECDTQYYSASGLRNDVLTGITLDAALGGSARLKTTAYYHHNRGYGTWALPYFSTNPPTDPLGQRATEYSINREGVTSVLSWSMGDHDLKAGVWLETNFAAQARRYYALTGANLLSPYDFPAPSALLGTDREFQFKTNNELAFVSDTWHVSPALTLNAGFKSLSNQISGKQLIVGANFPSGDIQSSKGFLPQIGVNYQLGDNYELFADYAMNMRGFQGSGFGLTPYVGSKASFDAVKGNLRPEVSRTFEAGLRFGQGNLEGVVAAYHVEFSDRLLATTQGIPQVGNAAVLSNVGGVRMNGLEFSASWAFMPSFSWYNALGVNRTEYANDYASAGTTYNTSGKTVVDVPTTTVKSILSFAQNGLFANLGLDYMGKRYYTYLNDGAVGGRTLFNLSAGYKAGDLGLVKEPTIQLSVDNLTDKRYVATIGSNGFVNSDPTGSAQTLLVGSPRAVFVTVSGKI